MRTSSFAIGLACLALSSVARADGAPPTPPAHCAAIEGGSPALEAIDAEERIAFIRSVMRDQGARANLWRWGWSGVGFALSAGQFALLPLYPKDKWFEQAFAGTASLYLPLSLAVFPLRIQHYSDILERAAKDAEGADGAHMMPCLVLDHAEDQLRKAAEDEAALTSALMQVATIVLNAGYGAIFAIAWKDLAATLENGIGALVIGETQFFTTPRGAVRALARYRRGDVSGAPAPAKVSWTVAPLGPAPGLSIVATF